MLQPERPAARARARRADRRRLRLRAAHPGGAARPSGSGSTSTRRCCRAGAARRPSSARSWPATTRRASRSTRPSRSSTPGRSRPSARSRSGPRTTPARSSRARRSSPSTLLDERARRPEPVVQTAGEAGVTYAEKIVPDDRVLDLDRPADELVRQRARALAAHRRARRAARAPVTVWRARVGDRRLVRAARGAARRRPADGRTRRGCAGCGDAPRLRARRPSRSCGASSRTTPMPTGRFARPSEGLDERDRALARRLAYGTVQRVRTLDHAIEALGRRPVRKLDPPVRAALRLGAYQLGFLDGVPRYAAVNESVELVRRARLERAVAFANAVLRRLADGIRPLRRRAAREHAAGGRAPPLVPRLGRRDVVARPRRRRRARAACAHRTSRLSRRPARPRRDRRAGPTRTFPGAWHVDRVDETAVAEGRIWPQSRGSQLAGLAVGSRAGERTLDLCAAPGGKATMLAGEVVAVEVNEARARELEENVAPARRGERPRSSTPTAATLPPRADGLRPRARRRALLGSRRARRAGPTCAGAPSRCRSSSSSCSPPRRRASGRGARSLYSVCTINREEAEDVVDASGLSVDGSLGEEWPQFRHHDPAGVPPDAAARARHERLLRRAAPRALTKGRCQTLSERAVPIV